MDRGSLSVQIDQHKLVQFLFVHTECQDVDQRNVKGRIDIVPTHYEIEALNFHELSIHI